jgi:ribosomal protein S18 acetylase RimI-like enzyme
LGDVRLRRYRRRDRDAVLRITRESFAGVCLDHNIEQRFGTVQGTTWQERKAAGIESDLSRHPQDAFVAELHGEVVGFVCTRVYRATSTGHIANLAVSPEHRGRGVGRALVEHALEHFRGQGLSFARIETLEQNQVGQHLYPAAGFEEIGRQVFYFQRL